MAEASFTGNLNSSVRVIVCVRVDISVGMEWILYAISSSNGYDEFSRLWSTNMETNQKHCESVNPNRKCNRRKALLRIAVFDFIRNIDEQVEPLQLVIENYSSVSAWSSIDVQKAKSGTIESSLPPTSMVGAAQLTIHTPTNVPTAQRYSMRRY